MDPTQALVLLAMTSGLALLPSASVMLVVARAAVGGVAHGLAVAAGIATGDALLLGLALSGWVALAEAAGGAFVVARYLAAAYLLGFGISLLRAPGPDAGGWGAGLRSRSPSLLGSFSAGLFLTLGDLKAIFFYASLLPAVVEPATMSVIDALAVFLVVLAGVTVPKVGYAWLGARSVRLTGAMPIARSLRRAVGAILVGAGGWLVVKG